MKNINFFNLGIHIGALLLILLAHTALTGLFLKPVSLITYWIGVYAIVRFCMKPLEKRLRWHSLKNELKIEIDKK